MDNLLQQLQEQLKQYSSDNNREKLPILEILWNHYFQTHPMNNDRIKQIESILAPAFEAISLNDSNEAFILLYDLVESYQHAAFIEGIQVGLQIDGLLHKKCTP